MKYLKGVHIGTSGWHYAHWRGPFYPEDLREKGFLKYYSARFMTVEVNNTFYRLPEEKTLLDWRASVPRGFLFSIKASRYITHTKKLKDPEKTLPPLLDRIRLLEDRLGPILFQLPPGWGLNIARLEGFMKTLPKSLRYAFEFRNADWFNEDVRALLGEHNAAFCIYDLGGATSPKWATADFVYLRLHGPDGPYRGEYGVRRLGQWARDIKGWLGEGRAVYCYFDNDEAGYAPKDALRLMELLKGE
jgi:uncharacterized protein YecE (DUF72 family)